MRRRTFLLASTAGLLSSAVAPSTHGAFGSSKVATSSGKAKSTILFFLSGGASHIDMWDMKPNAPVEYRGPFRPIETTAPGVRLCEHLPLLAKQAHHLALLNSIDGTVNTNDHHAGYYYNLTGHVPDQSFLTLGNNRTPFPDDWPFLGSVVGSRRPAHSYLTNTITLPHVEGAPVYTRPGQFSAKLGIEHDPLYIHGTREKPLEFRAPVLALEGSVTAERLLQRQSLLGAVNNARRIFDQDTKVQNLSRTQQKAFSLLMSARTTEAFDLQKESEATRDRYGNSINGLSLLLARRLVEAEVPFITVFWMGDPAGAEKRKCASGGGWDTHGNNFDCLQHDLLPEFDRGFSALIEDLAQRGLLDETLVMVTSEMGRKPKIGDPRSGGVSGAGRDHWTHCLTDVLAGGGIRGGQTYGSSDAYAQYPQNNRITPAHVVKTVYHAMGIDDIMFTDTKGQPLSLLAEGEPIRELF